MRLEWGAHLCQLYRTAEDLASTLVPYFAAGISGGEKCLWITADPLRAEAARQALARAVPDLDARLARGQVQIVDFERWYLEGGEISSDEVIARWLAAEEQALREGYPGLRLTGNTAWVRRQDWAAFAEYERRVHGAFRGRRILAVCSYALQHCSAAELLDVVRHHGLTLARVDGMWTRVQGATEALAAAGGSPGVETHDAIVYRAPGYPAERVAEYLAAGLRGGEGVAVVLGQAHGAAVRRALAAHGLDAAAAERSGQLEWLDAEVTLPGLLEDGRVSPSRFAALVPPLLERLRARFGRLRLYGEMVDLLSRRGDFEGALALERLWNALLRESPVPVLCTYDAGAFAADALPGRLGALHAEHRRLHLVEREGGEDAETFQALVTELAARSDALRAEASRRAEAESARDRWERTTRQARAHLARLQRVTAALLSTRSASDLGAVAVTTMAEALGASSALLAACTGEGLEVVAQLGGVAPVFALDAGPVADAVRLRRPLLLAGPEAVRERYPALTHRGPAALAVLPLEAAGAVLGALAFGFDAPRPFSPADEALLEDLARQAALALERARLLAELEEARARAEGASRAKDEFLAMLGHELRNPLSPMRTVVHLMGRRAPEAFQRERGILERQLRHVERLVDDLLDVSRIARGTLTLRTERLELGEVVAHAVEAVSPLVAERQHRLRARVPAAGLPVEGDPHRLVQAVVNLLVNAAKYTPPGGTIEVDTAVREGRVALRVVDDGPGLAPELAGRVFEPFVQGPRGLARSEGGLGLGLAITRSIVELHGGSIRVESPAGARGSAFTLELALAPVTPSAVAGAAPAAEAHPPGARLLVVDDNEDAAETLADALRCAGHAVATAHDPRAALEVARRFAPDVAVLDVGLPELDGWQLGARLRALAPDAPPHCIAVTGYGTEDDRQASSAAGFAAHLVKPVDIERLERIIAGLLAARQAEAG